jgi:hypothetical protein
MTALFMYDSKKEIKSMRCAIVSSLFIFLSFWIAKYSQSLAMYIDGKSLAIDTYICNICDCSFSIFLGIIF